jgi:pyridoxal/pyridoxine/pyridoxamine kinase
MARKLTLISRFKLITPNGSEASLLCDHDLKFLIVKKHSCSQNVSQGIEIVIISLAEFELLANYRDKWVYSCETD